MIRMRADERASLKEWDLFKDQILKATPVDLNETPEQQRRRIAKLETDPEAWFKHYFPNYAFAEPAPFHKKATRRILATMEHYEVRAWARDLAKTTRTMFEVLFLVLTKKKKVVLFVSNNATSAERLLLPYKLNLEANQRIIHDYGLQQYTAKWEAGEFTTKSGASFIATGAGQSPRGTRKEEVRPDVIIFDDIDTDEECRNPEIIKNKWNWIEKSAIGTRSSSKPTTILFCGNIIAPDCCINRAIEMADHVDIINIRDKTGKSSWGKNTEENIDRVLSKISYASAQGEYFNNPITEGSVFKNLAFKKMPRITEYPFLVCYTDPSFRQSQRSDYKATALVAPWHGERHILKMFCQQTSTANMVEWLYQIDEMVKGKVPIYYFIEKNLNDEDIRRHLYEASKAHGNKVLAVAFDNRAKPEKFSRIESNLEPLDRNGQLYFNEDEQDFPDMKNAIDQFKAFSPKSRAHDDAPDAVEGAMYYLNSKADRLVSAEIETIKRPANAKRF